MKRRSRTILKQLNGVLDEVRNGKRQGQEQIQRLKKVHLERDEFTEHKELEDVLVKLTVQARQLEDHYQGQRKRMIQTAALELEDRLNKVGKGDLVCHISEELIKVLKVTGINWSPIYLRRCLDERYKNPVNRLNALARKSHPGVPQDTGRTEEKLEASLNRKAQAKEFTKKTNLRYVGKNILKTLITIGKRESQSSPRLFASRIPIIVKVNAVKQEVIVEVDKEEYNKQMRYEKDYLK